MESPKDLIVRFEMPIRTYNPLNGKQGNWIQKGKDRKEQRGVTKLCASAHMRASALPRNIIVKLTRLSYGTLDDDGLRAAFKSVRDGMADFLGIDDRHIDLVRYDYDQIKVPKGEWGVIVEVYPMHSATPPPAQLDEGVATLQE